jgi:enoyl-CoA hydratase/carnithine racemase
VESITVERDGRVRIVTLARGKANALNASMIAELGHALEAAAADPDTGAVVLASASTRMFSAGFDLAEVFAYDGDAMRPFFRRFVDLLETLRSFPKPVVAAVSGHAYAGGALLALACDFRVMAEGEFGFALNEVNLGLVLPVEGTRWMAPVLGSATREVLLGGSAIPPDRALRIGLAAVLAPPDQVRERSIVLARELADKPPFAFAAIKAGILEATTGGTLTIERREAFVEEFIRFWTGEESRQRRSALLTAMRK